MKEHIKKLIEQRTFEARKKNLTDKAMKVLLMFGQEIKHDSAYFAEDGEEDDLPYSDGGSESIGSFYDGLSQGSNFQITYLSYEADLKISFNGYTMYQETNGQLIKYAPKEEWENKLESLFVAAKGKEYVVKETDKDLKVIQHQREKFAIMDYLAKFWGFVFDSEEKRE